MTREALVAAYATTIHKSQGSEYPAVVITLATHTIRCSPETSVYTAVTRGKRLVVIVGQRKALAIAVRTHGSKRRWTKAPRVAIGAPVKSLAMKMSLALRQTHFSHAPNRTT